MNAAGVIGIRNAFDLPAFGATLVQGGNLTLAVRFDDGSWTLVGRLDDPARSSQDPEDVTAVTQAPRSAAVLVSTRYRTLIVGLPQESGTAQLLTAVPKMRDSAKVTALAYASEATGEILRARQAPRDATHWGRLRAGRFERVGGDLPPLLGDVSIDAVASPHVAWQMEIPSRHEAAFWSSEELTIYADGSMRRVPGTSPAELGFYLKVIDLQGAGRVWLNSAHGLFELGRDDTLRRIEAPFPTKDDVEVAFAFGQVPGFGAALALTDDGLFSIDGSGRFPRPLGGAGLRLQRDAPSAVSAG